MLPLEESIRNEHQSDGDQRARVEAQEKCGNQQSDQKLRQGNPQQRIAELERSMDTTPRTGDDRMQDHKSTDRNLQDAGSARRVSWVNGPRASANGSAS